MPIRIVGARISSSNGPTGSILCLLANWNKSGSGIAQSYASTQATSLLWIHNRVNPRHQLPVASIIRQFSLAPSLLSQRATVAPSSKGQSQYQDKSQYKGERKGKPPSWTLEEDIILYNCLQENKPIVDFYHQFPGRSMHAVYTRAYRLRNAYFVPPEKGGLVEDADMTVTQRVDALRRIAYKYSASESKTEGFYVARTTSTHMNYKKPLLPFSEEEKEMLVKLVYKYRHDPEMWAKVSGGRVVDEEEAPRLNRPVTSCKAAWRLMNRDESIKLGKWDKHECQRLVKAIRGQVGDEYEICLGAKGMGSDESNQPAAKSGSDTKLALRLGSPVLQGLDWERIASEVRTRTAIQCLSRFRHSMHDGETRSWTAIEMERLLEGYKLYGRQWDKVAEHIGTRSFQQARYKHSYLRKAAKRSEE